MFCAIFFDYEKTRQNIPTIIYYNDRVVKFQSNPARMNEKQKNYVNIADPVFKNNSKQNIL